MYREIGGITIKNYFFLSLLIFSASVPVAIYCLCMLSILALLKLKIIKPRASIIDLKI